MTLSIGIIGCGAVVHRNYLPTLLGRSEYRVEYLVDRNAEQARSAAELFGARVTDLDEVRSQADVVIVATPPASHRAIVSAVLAPNRIVLCEKPYMVRGADAASMNRQAREVGARLYVGHFRRNFPHLQLARDIVSSGVIGNVTHLSASEGGRFTWSAVSDYTLKERTGGVLWDTGSHTLDMALFAAGLDDAVKVDISSVDVTRDKPEPSHEFAARFAATFDSRPITGHLRLSRRQATPNIVRVKGTSGEVSFTTGLDDRVRLTGPSGSTVVVAERAYDDLMECIDVQNQRILLQQGAEIFEADRFVAQVRLLEALSDA